MDDSPPRKPQENMRLAGWEFKRLGYAHWPEQRQQIMQR